MYFFYKINVKKPNYQNFQRILTGDRHQTFEEFESKTSIYEMQAEKTNRYDIKPIQFCFEPSFNFCIHRFYCFVCRFYCLSSS